MGPIPDNALYLTDAVALVERRGITRDGFVRALARADVVALYQYASPPSGALRSAPLSQRPWQMEIDGAFDPEAIPPSHILDSGRVMLQPGWGENSDGATPFVYRAELLAWLDRMRPRLPRTAEVPRPAVARVTTIDRPSRVLMVPRDTPSKPIEVEPKAASSGAPHGGATTPPQSGKGKRTRGLGTVSRIIHQWFVDHYGSVDDAILAKAKGESTYGDLARLIAADTKWDDLTETHLHQWRETMTARGVLSKPD
jgi:hypothetical protein